MRPRTRGFLYLCVAGIVLVGAIAAAEGASTNAVPGLRNLTGLRLATAANDPKDLLNLRKTAFDEAIAEFLKTDGTLLRRYIRTDAPDFLALLVNVDEARYMNFPIGVYGVLRLVVFRHGVVRRTGEEADVVVWDHWLGFFTREAQDARDSVPDRADLLLDRLQTDLLTGSTFRVDEAPVAGRFHPCKPFRPYGFRLDVRLRDRENLLGFGPLDLRDSVLDLLTLFGAEVEGMYDPIGDDMLQVQIDCRTVVWHGVRFGLAGSVRVAYLEPIILTGGRTCVPGATFIESEMFFVDTREEAEETIFRLLGELVDRLGNDLSTGGQVNTTGDAEIGEP